MGSRGGLDGSAQGEPIEGCSARYPQAIPSNHVLRVFRQHLRPGARGAMNRSLATVGAGSLLGLFTFSAWGVDDRALVFEYSKLANAGSPASAGHEAAGDTNAGANGGSESN